MSIAVTYFSDPGCPWAYAANPALTVLRWRYRHQLRWRMVMIGLAEDPDRYLARGYTPAVFAHGYGRFRRRGMPFTTEPRPRIVATGRACRAVVAARLLDPELEWATFRALQLAWFTTTLLLDEDDDIATALTSLPPSTVKRIVADIDGEEVEATYQADRAEARSAAGTPAEFQGKAASTDGSVRYTAPSLAFNLAERRLEAGGFQPLEAYDVLVANLDPTLDREAPASNPGDVLAAFPDGLTTFEVAAVMTQANDAIDPAAAEQGLIDLVAGGLAGRIAIGQDALWQDRPAGAPSP